MSGEYDYEHGWQALRGLTGRVSPHLALLLAQRNFTPISPRDMVMVEACPLCADGGLRMAGYLRRGRHLRSVRQCDTCLAVAVGLRFMAGALQSGPVSGEADDDLDDRNDDDGADDDGADDDGGDTWRRYG